MHELNGLTGFRAKVAGWRASSWDRLPAALRPVVWLGLSLLVLGVPLFDDIWLRMFFLIALYVTLGLGLNVVVGMAGLLDLGFVAFFAAGAYTVGMLSSPASPQVSGYMDFWLLLPMAVLVGASMGLLLGLPVLRLRGDYLAIVTLGFGEIIRILALNMPDWTNGSSGLYEIRPPNLGFRQIDDVRSFYVLAVLAAFIVWFVTARIRDSHTGRAWEAIREEEDVAAAMGVSTTRYKLMAFSLGAAIGGLGGAIYAPFITFIAPASFSLLVSINVLALVIIGGMGSTQGVVFGALVLIGMPELLQFEETGSLLARFGWLRSGVNAVIDLAGSATGQDLASLPPAEEWGAKLALYRYIIFGAVLVLVMVLRPSGIFPSKRRQREFRATAGAGPDQAAGTRA